MDLVKTFSTALLLLLLGGSFQAAAQDQSAAFAASYAAEAKADYPGAITALRTGYSGTYEQNLRLGWLYFLAKNYTTASSYYQKAVEQRPYALEPKFGLIKPLNALNQVAQMQSAYLSILKIDPQNTQANYWVGVILLNQKAYDKAARYFERVVNLYPFDYDANLSLAWCYLNMGRKTDARVLYTKALLIRPNDPTATAGLKRTQ
ncbi:tetratricopeptide repeat protein [Hymenobacter aquaticus]|uniref:Tetratricopeptide repeat protein n=1 Tax=Hymenobacter aquaticus TaxID=1867101 RepID=A0A4Z0Q5N8_9BACT|nr:tetratricopeptide repeat protein [Hymenobacter aquaticus]TGE24985.1 tetratricopeptide repeat protein [Hymenobacter aquaticus]